MLNFVICDDNINILEKMEKLLETIFMKNNLDATIAFRTTSSDEILDYVEHNPVDVLMLDINLRAQKTGIDVAREFRKKKKNAYLIFTTGHLEYAMIAYKYKTFDYIAKPITYDRLEETITRLFEDISDSPKRYIKIDSKSTVVDESEVQYIKRDGMKLVFHTATNDYDTYSSFNKFQDKLPKHFVRCHKSYIANIKQIKDVDPVSATITFKNGDTCDIGPKYKREFMEVIQNYGNF